MEQTVSIAPMAMPMDAVRGSMLVVTTSEPEQEAFDTVVTDWEIARGFERA